MENISKNENIAEQNSLEKDFLQSSQWRKFQESVGRRVFSIQEEDFSASIIGHKLPIVGSYFYVPRGPVFMEHGTLRMEQKSGMQNLIKLGKKESAGWIRIEPKNEEILQSIKNEISEKIVRAPHDMQPRETFVLDITKDPENLLAEMKPKTRYNIGLAKKRGVKIVTWDKGHGTSEYVVEFLRLTKEMAERQGISAHPEEYYRKMISSFPADMLKIYVAEYEGPASTRGDDHSSTRGGKIIAANLVLFFGKTATYLHGASGDAHRNVMAPFLLQWQAILDAKEKGCTAYDFGGIQTEGTQHQKHSDLVGVTNFKMGFSQKAMPVVFPGSYDIIINSRRYWAYRGLQRAKSFAVRLRR